MVSAQPERIPHPLRCGRGPAGAMARLGPQRARLLRRPDRPDPAGRLAGAQAEPSRAAEPPSGVCPDLVGARADPLGCLYRLCDQPVAGKRVAGPRSTPAVTVAPMRAACAGQWGALGYVRAPRAPA